MFLEFKHGGHALLDPATEISARFPRGRISSRRTAHGEDFDPDTMTPFRYLLDQVGRQRSAAGR